MNTKWCTSGTWWPRGPNRIKRRNCHISICSATYRDGTIRSFDVDWSWCKEFYWIIERYILENAHWLCTWASLWNQGICSQFLGGKNHNCRSILLIGGMKHFKCFFWFGGGCQTFLLFYWKWGYETFLESLREGMKHLEFFLWGVWNISSLIFQNTPTGCAG